MWFSAGQKFGCTGRTAVALVGAMPGGRTPKFTSYDYA